MWCREALKTRRPRSSTNDRRGTWIGMIRSLDGRMPGPSHSAGMPMVCGCLNSSTGEVQSFISRLHKSEMVTIDSSACCPEPHSGVFGHQTASVLMGVLI